MCIKGKQINKFFIQFATKQLELLPRQTVVNKNRYKHEQGFVVNPDTVKCR